MTAWTSRNFTRPYLQAVVGRGTEPNEIELRHGTRIMSLRIDGDLDAARGLLNSLTDPASEAWRHAGQEESSALNALLVDLDRQGWLVESDRSGQQHRTKLLRQLTETAAQARAWLAAAGVGPITGHEPGTLATATLAACRTTWRRSSPLTDQILASILDAPGDRGDDDRSGPGDEIDHQAAPASVEPGPGLSGRGPGWDGMAVAVVDGGDVVQQVWAGVQLAVMSRTPTLAARYPGFVPASVPDGPGINLLVEAERCAEALLRELGPPEILALIAEPGGARRAAPVVYQHRWFETIRYVEAAAGLLTSRLGCDLRTLVLRYLGEEAGHEAHELDTCRQLGVTDEALGSFAPLAWFAAYPEVLATQAQRRPLSFLLAMTVAEGLPGAGRRLTEQLLDHGVDAPAAADHDELDRELDHEMVTRTMLACIPWVDGVTGRVAIADFLQIVEIAHRAWQLLSRVVAAGRNDRLGPFELPAQILLDLCETR